jgi:hypothetical protein
MRTFNSRRKTLELLLRLANGRETCRAIQSHDDGLEMAPCHTLPCTGALEARGPNPGSIREAL